MMTLHPEISTADTEDGRVLLDERTGRYLPLDPNSASTLSRNATGCTSTSASYPRPRSAAGSPA